MLLIDHTFKNCLGTNSPAVGGIERAFCSHVESPDYPLPAQETLPGCLSSVLEAFAPAQGRTEGQEVIHSRVLELICMSSGGILITLNYAEFKPL